MGSRMFCNCLGDGERTTEIVWRKGRESFPILKRGERGGHLSNVCLKEGKLAWQTQARKCWWDLISGQTRPMWGAKVIQWDATVICSHMGGMVETGKVTMFLTCQCSHYQTISSVKFVGLMIWRIHVWYIGASRENVTFLSIKCETNNYDSVCVSFCLWSYKKTTLRSYGEPCDDSAVLSFFSLLIFFWIFFFGYSPANKHPADASL